MSSNNGAADVAAMAVLLFSALFIATGLMFAGLAALFLAKLHEKRLLEEVNETIHPILLALCVTAFIVFGSAAGAFLAAFHHVDDGACELNRTIRPRYDCTRSGIHLQNGGASMSLELYFFPLLKGYALWFWLKLSAALWFIEWVAKRFKNSPAERAARWELIKIYSGVVAIIFAASSMLIGQWKYGGAGCDPSGTLCEASKYLDPIPALLLGKIANILDAWLNPFRTLKSSLGNQFKLDDLVPLIFFARFAYYWMGPDLKVERQK